MSQPKSEHASVQIYDQAYHLSGPDPDQVRQLAAMVDARMRAVSASSRMVDSLRVAVLAALNLADELTRAEARIRQLQGGLEATESANLRIRAANLQDLLDSVLEEE